MPVVNFSKRGRRPPASRFHRRPSRIGIGSVLGFVALAGIGGLELGFPLVGCDVKGNISMNTGERIYHVPGQEYYGETRIDWLKGERWFCTEQAARGAGWRRAYR